jgi:hypothetical protein
MSSTTITLRLDKKSLARIDKAATQYGQSRNTYILKWVPEYYPATGWELARDTQTSVVERASDARVAR